MAHFLDAHPVGAGDQRYVLKVHMQDDVFFVQHFVVFQVVQHRSGHFVRVGGHEHRRALHACRVTRQRLDHRCQRQRGLSALLTHQTAAAFPGRHQQQNDARHHQREPAAIRNFDRCGGQERDVHRCEHNDGQRRERLVPLPQAKRHDRKQNGVDEHRAGHGEAVRRCQIFGAAKRNHNQQHEHEQRPIYGWQINLTFRTMRGVHHLHAWQKAQLNTLTRDRERAGNHRLRRNH